MLPKRYPGTGRQLRAFADLVFAPLDAFQPSPGLTSQKADLAQLVERLIRNQ